MEKQYTILIIDDEQDVHTVLGKMLNKEGYIVQSAFSASQAQEMISQAKPDLILLDIMMPKTSGIELLNDLRTNLDTKDLLIIIISAKDEQTDRLEGLTHGADDYISKPFHLRSLVRKIEHVLQKKKEKNFQNEIS